MKKFVIVEAVKKRELQFRRIEKSKSQEGFIRDRKKAEYI